MWTHLSFFKLSQLYFLYTFSEERGKEKAWRFKNRRSLRCLKLIASRKYSCNLVTFLLKKYVKQRLYLPVNVIKAKKRQPIHPKAIHCWDKPDNLNSSLMRKHPNLNVFASKMHERLWRGTYSTSICLKEEILNYYWLTHVIDERYADDLLQFLVPLVIFPPGLPLSLYSYATLEIPSLVVDLVTILSRQMIGHCKYILTPMLVMPFWH